MHITLLPFNSEGQFLPIQSDDFQLLLSQWSLLFLTVLPIHQSTLLLNSGPCLGPPGSFLAPLGLVCTAGTFGKQGLESPLKIYIHCHLILLQFP